MTYKVQITNGIAVLGYLWHGKVRNQPHGYPHPSSAERAAKSYVAKHPSHKYKVIPWNRYEDSVLFRE